MNQDPASGPLAAKSAPPSLAYEAGRARRRVWVGAGLLLAAFIASVLASRDAHLKSEPQFSQPPAAPSTQGLVGFPGEVDVLGNLALAGARTARNQLVGIEASGVASSGHVDVRALGHWVRYAFQSAAGEGPVPKRRPGTLAAPRYCGQQAVELTQAGIGEQQDLANSSCERALPPLAKPGCGPRELWQLARAKGVAADQLARVRYFAAKSGPAWHFEAKEAGVEFTVSAADCNSEINP
jgi:hypothetical protein